MLGPSDTDELSTFNYEVYINRCSKMDSVELSSFSVDSVIQLGTREYSNIF